jgi:hypothetical protein
MSDQIIQNYLDDAIRSFRSYKSIAEKAMAQTDDAEFFQPIDAEANSVGLIVKHIAGNLVSRWTDFLTSDGEKPDRNRDTEFEIILGTRVANAFRFGRASDGRGFFANRHDQGRTAHNRRGAEPANDALRIPRRADRPARQTLSRVGMEDVERAEKPFGGVRRVAAETAAAG